MELPTISDKTNLTIAEAKAEFIELAESPIPKYGWSTGAQTLIDNRLIWLKQKIFNDVMEQYKEQKNGR